VHSVGVEAGPRSTGWAQTLKRFTLWSLSVTAACLPLYVVRWHVGPLPTTLLELLILVTVAAYIATLVTERRLPAVRTWLNIPIAFLLLAGLIGIAAAPDYIRALGIYRAYFIEAIACFYIAVDILRTREELRVFLLTTAVGASVMAAGEIVSFLWTFAQGSLHLTSAPAFLNTSPNPVAMYLEPPLAFALAFTVFPSRPRERWLALGVLVVVFVAIVLTLSRASYLAMTVLAVVLVLSLQQPKWRLRAVGVISVLGLVVLEIPFVNERLLGLARSVTNRTSLYHQAFEVLSQRPLQGAGISGFATRVEPFRPKNQPIHIYPHDVWLTTWSELGLLGLLSFAVIFFGLLWTGFRALSKAADIHRPLLWGAVGALVLYAVHGLFDSPYWKNDLSVEFWLIAALQVVAVRGAGGATDSARTVSGP
jgi:O-antigen ligase